MHCQPARRWANIGLLQAGSSGKSFIASKSYRAPLIAEAFAASCVHCSMVSTFAA